MSDGRLSNPLAHRFAAAIRLNDHVDLVDALEVRRIAIFAPMSCAGNTQRRDAVVPERVNVRLALDQDHLPSVSRFVETVQSIQLRLRTGLPTKPVALKGNSESGGQKLTG